MLLAYISLFKSTFSCPSSVHIIFFANLIKILTVYQMEGVTACRWSYRLQRETDKFGCL